jgi:hypothetical protein
MMMMMMMTDNRQLNYRHAALHFERPSSWHKVAIVRWPSQHLTQCLMFSSLASTEQT